MTGFGVWLVQPRVTAALVGFVLMPMIVPPVVSAVTLHVLLTSLSGVSTAIGHDTWPGVAIAHVVMMIAVTLFVTSVNAITLPRLVGTGLRDNFDPAVAAISVVLIAITVAVVAAVVLSSHLRARGRPGA